MPPRPTEQTVAVDADWYRHLPLAPSLATDAYPTRSPAAMRERGEIVADSHRVTFGLRLLTLTNDFRPLPDGPQKQLILALGRANGITDGANLDDVAATNIAA